MVPEGKNYKSLPPEYAGIYKYHEALTRYHSKKPSPTINTGHRSHFHYKWNRIEYQLLEKVQGFSRLLIISYSMEIRHSSIDK